VTNETRVITRASGQRFLVTKEVEFDAGHRVPLHESKCKNPHGHRYKVKAHVSGPLKTAGSESGMVVDFGRIKQLLTTRVHDKYDHGFIVQDIDETLRAFLLNEYSGDDGELLHADWNVTVVDYPPTAENLAAEIFRDLVEKIAEMGPDVQLEFIEVWETPTSVAGFPA
jgi:6-pyruvoyltetrahydropterin/6-carboxytetrahydropterin synthase